MTCECEIHELGSREVLEKLSAWANRESARYAQRTGDYEGAAELSHLSQRADDLLDTDPAFALPEDLPECCERAVRLERERVAICMTHGLRAGVPTDTLFAKMQADIDAERQSGPANERNAARAAGFEGAR